MINPDVVTTGVVVAAALQIAKQGQDFIAAALGHPGESLGTILGTVGRRRVENVEAVGNKAHLILLNIGIEPQEAQLNVIQPLIEAASLQEDPALQDIWANLLANATDPRQTSPVFPAFPHILKELGSAHVKFLDAVYKDSTKQAAPNKKHSYTRDQLLDIYTGAGLARLHKLSHITNGYHREHKSEIEADISDFDTMMDLFHRHRLFEEDFQALPTKLDVDFSTRFSEQHIDVDLRRFFSLTELGIRFIEACSAPKQPENRTSGDVGG